ncbi:MAG: hypothetical protein K2X81_17130 [Candidatus Obscuribacterales bacterium]|nr:hypothetical protein [Candidatus Obscuribacterales bacterium]
MKTHAPNIGLFVILSLLSCAGISNPAFAETSAASMPTTVVSATAKPLAFSEVNALFRKDYTNAKEEIRQKLGPIIICTGDSISLLRGKDKTLVPFVKPRYTGLKELAHITLGTYVILVNHTDEVLDDATLLRLRAFHDAIEQAKGKLANEGLEPDDTKEQEEIIGKTISFLNRAINDKKVTRLDLQNFARSTAKNDMDNAYGAVSSQLATIDAQVAAWRKDMSVDDWNKLHVILITGHMPRQQQSSFQYFSKLLGQKREGQRIIVMESSENDEQAVDLLLTHELDRKVAIDFFKDPWRMHRDLLSDAAKKYLQKHKLESRDKNK